MNNLSRILNISISGHWKQGSMVGLPTGDDVLQVGIPREGNR